MLLPWSLIVLLCWMLPHTSAAVTKEASASNNASLLWGAYRPGVYLGIRPRVAEHGILAGLMWGETENVHKTLRHGVNMTHGMATYGWKQYDAREGGRHVVEDVRNKINITADFVKGQGEDNAYNWGLRVRGIPRDGVKQDLKTTVVFYMGMEAMQSCNDCKIQAKDQRVMSSVHVMDVDVSHPQLGQAAVHIAAPNTTKNGKVEEMKVFSVRLSEDRLWQARCVGEATFLDLLTDEKKFQSGPPSLKSENMHFVQIQCYGTFEFDVLYSSHAASRAMTSAQITRNIETNTLSFKKKFAYAYGPKKPYDEDKYRVFSEEVLSNLLGGLGYFTGATKVDASKKAIYAETTQKFWEKSKEAQKHSTPEIRGPYQLLSHTPSRPLFPRGFLWDEGFHLLLVLDWDADLAIEVILSWMALMDDDGWIAREQILGPEAESATPEEFVIQYPHIANPPMLFLVLSRFVDLLERKTKYYGRDSSYLSDQDKGKALMLELYPLLKRHYEWFRRTQSGNVEAHSIPSANLNEGYRWRGREPESNLASGLDDFPRAEPPDTTELHVDALCWVGVMARSLEQFALFTQSTIHEAFLYQKHLRDIKTNMEILHWDDKQQLYCDGIVRKDTHTFECHKGYISLFPLLTGFLGAIDWKLPPVLDLLQDPKHLWTSYGIRSLSPENERYGVDKNYWRSPIWINMNYLILVQLLTLARTAGPSQQRCREIYAQLRLNIIDTVYDAWLQTGYIWEQYDPVDGHGQRAQHFTGWSALVVKIMAMPDLEQGEGFGGKMKDYYHKAKSANVQNKSASGVLFIMVVMLFIYFTRRRFAGTLRSWRSRSSV